MYPPHPLPPRYGHSPLPGGGPSPIPEIDPYAPPPPPEPSTWAQRLVLLVSLAGTGAFIVYEVLMVAEIRLFGCTYTRHSPAWERSEPVATQGLCRVREGYYEAAIYSVTGQLYRLALVLGLPLLVAIGLTFLWGRERPAWTPGRLWTSLVLAAIGVLMSGRALLARGMRGEGAGWDELSVYLGLGITCAVIAAISSRGRMPLAAGAAVLFALTLAS